VQAEPPVVVLRLGHRPGRDERMTTHVGLAARALGADSVVLAGAGASRAQTIEDITDRFGGPFAVETTEQEKTYLQDWEGTIVHLTMYGEPIQDVIADVADAHREGPLLVVVGAEKVSFDVYDAADYNVGVTNQPHSEVAALAVFLDRLFDGRELTRSWENATRRVVPTAAGKRMERVGEDGPRTDDVGSGGGEEP